MSTQGAELFQKLASTGGETKASTFVTSLRRRVSLSLEEIVLVGARVRPLMIGGHRVGWVRGLPIEERIMISRWVGNTWGPGGDHVRFLIREATSLTNEQIDDLSLVEVSGLVRMINQMTAADNSLHAFIPAFVTTLMSERIWYSRGQETTTRVVDMPDGFQFKLRTTHEIIRMWGYYSTLRHRSLEKIDQAINSAALASAFSKPKTDPIQQLNKLKKSLNTDSDAPWVETAHRLKDGDYAKHLDDGWGRSDDDSVDGIMREYKGMIEGDNHEKVMDMFYNQQSAEEEAEELVRKALNSKHREVIESGRRVLTFEDIREKDRATMARRNAIANLANNELSQAEDAEAREERKQQVMRRVQPII